VFRRWREWQFMNRAKVIVGATSPGGFLSELGVSTHFRMKINGEDGRTFFGAIHLRLCHNTNRRLYIGELQSRWFKPI
jgi:hypothetical protein